MSVFLRKDQAGGVGDYEWTHNGEVVEVDDDTALDLLRIPHAGFSVAEAPSKDVQEQIAHLDDEPDGTPEIPLNFEEDGSHQSNLTQALAATSTTSGRKSARKA